MPDVRMAFIGDTYVQRPDPDAVFQPNLHHFQQADVLFANLETVVADEQYLRESILYPSRKTVKEFKPGLMETVVKENALSEEEVDALIAYIETLD
jgi:hypothetical protein